MAQKMGWGDSFGLANANTCFKRKNRWLFKIPDVSAEGIDALPPLKSGRPELSFKELQMEHLVETVYFPGKPEWKPINLTLYDLKKNENPILKWISDLYDVPGTYSDNKFSAYKFSVGFKKPNAQIELYDGTGEVIETWLMQAIWPTTIAWGDLDMGSSDVVTVDLTLRYDRAWEI